MRRWLGDFTELPRLMQLGLFIFAVGGALGVVYHAAPLAWTTMIDIYLGHDGLLAHLVTLAGMIVTMAGVFLGRPARAPRAQSRPTAPCADGDEARAQQG